MVDESGKFIPFWRFALALTYGEDEANEKKLLDLSGNEWQDACERVFYRARRGEIVINATKSAEKKETRSWYPPEATVDEAIPATFFQHELQVGCLDPFPIQYVDPSRGGIFNSPYVRPMVLVLTKADPRMARVSRSLSLARRSSAQAMADEWPIRMSLMEIAEWIVVKTGGKRISQLDLLRCNRDDDDYSPVNFSDEDVEIYDAATDKLLCAILAERLPMLGRRGALESGPLEVIPPGDFTELRSSLLAIPSFELMFSSRRYLDIVDGSIRNRWEVFWSGIVSRRDDVRKAFPNADAGRIGRPEGYNWPMINAKVFELMAHHGDFDGVDPEWNAQARLEEEILSFCAKQFQKEPALSTLRPRLRKFLEEWRATKSQR